jgi:rhodanese-related sulfurtransferase
MPRRLYLTGSLAGRVLALLLVSGVCAGLANTFSPARIPWVKDWSSHVETSARELGIQVVGLQDMQRISREGTHLVFDARPQADYDTGHIPTAMSLPFMEVDAYFDQYQMLLTPEQPIVVYCSGKECDESLLLASFFKDQGLTNVLLFAGGYGEWEQAGGARE